MTDNFATAMRRSLEQTRAGNPAEATRLIQEALRGTPSAPPAQQVRPQTLSQTRAQTGLRFDRRPSGSDRQSDDAIEDAEVLETRSPRRSFGQVIADLAEGSRNIRARSAGQTSSLQRRSDPIPEGARFERRRFEGSHGARDYRIYIPAADANGFRGVILMLHGCTQTPEDFAVGTAMNAQALPRGYVVAYPEQTRADNAQLCWNWFRPSDQGCAAGEPAILAGLAQALAREFAVPDRRIFAAGLSAGGAMAAILGHTHPELFGAVGVHSGLPPKSAQDVLSAFAAMRGDAGRGTEPTAVPTIVFQGMADSTVSPANAIRITGPLTNPDVRSVQNSGRRVRVTTGRTATGQDAEVWMIDGAGHAWSGGSARGSYADPDGPDASAEMIRFFEAQIET